MFASGALTQVVSLPILNDATPESSETVELRLFGPSGVAATQSITILDDELPVLLDELAVLRPDWSLVMVGPVVKIADEDLPRRPNIHYLGAKTYAQLPSYLGGWDVALMPFAMNESTEFISPTKTPEYLAGGKPVVSTPITDVIRPYGEMELVKIANGA